MTDASRRKAAFDSMRNQRGDAIVIPALLTPIAERGKVDTGAIERLIRFALGGRISGVLVLGSSGEGAYLSQFQRRQVVDAALQATADTDMFVVAAVPQNNIGEAIVEGANYLTAGCSELLVAPPTYGPDNAVKTDTYYRQLAAGFGPKIIAYNVPALTGASVPAEVVGSLAADGMISGVKDSSRDLEYLQLVLKLVGESPVRFFTGSDTLLLPSLLLGADGGITVGAGLAPGTVRALADSFDSGDLLAAAVLQGRLTDLIVGLRLGCFPAGFKFALSHLGLMAATPVGTAPPLLGQDQARVRETLIAHGLVEGVGNG